MIRHLLAKLVVLSTTICCLLALSIAASRCYADNPIVQTAVTADPAPLVAYATIPSHRTQASKRLVIGQRKGEFPGPCSSVRSASSGFARAKGSAHSSTNRLTQRFNIPASSIEIRAPQEAK